ncbi:2-dehydro-3-deoxygalactonokinase [Pedobacter arcticus]|uniref:2-dehydro-3-deoxygalactonokinase n=1 Tax=Pedobacter arcticus TaxID=752140 RepID=UPI0002FE7CA3|nr:2-dehydro-3-deoxygalactonokinase [Pedobacter arcticus]
MSYSSLAAESYLLCCDWGTSSLRLQLVDIISSKTVATSNAEDGVSKVFNEWKETSEVERLPFYQSRLKIHIDNISSAINLSLKSVPLVISGMASSSIGMVELPYSVLPFDLSGEKAGICVIEESEIFPHSILLVSGVQSNIDVMRGEETQFIGLEQIIQSLDGISNSLLIMTGTHSKHIRVIDGKMVDFNTYMTGELFSVLQKNSLLKQAIEMPTGDLTLDDFDAFSYGIQKSASFNLLKNLFSVRTGELFQHRNKRQNYFYLSGLLIGTELRSVLNGNWEKIILCSGNKLFELYKKAIEELGMGSVAHFVLPEAMTDATILGQIKIYQSKYHDVKY